MKFLPLTGLALLGLAACHSQTQPATETAPPATHRPAPAAALPTVANSPGAAYRVYRGRLPGQPDSLTLHLVTAPQPLYDATGPSSHGSYYGPDGHPYELQSLASPADTLVLNDLSPEHGAGPTGEAPAWRLRRQPGGGLAGTVGGQPLRLRLVPAPAGGLTFAVRCFADSLAAYPIDPAHSPKAHVSLQLLVPAGGPDKVVIALQANMLRDLRGDTLGGLPAPALATFFTQQRDLFYKDYREDIADMLAGSSPGERPSAMLNYQDQTSTYVLYRQGNLLSVAYFDYTYTGGAHGLNGTTTASYDLRTGDRLRYDDIFVAGAAAQLPALLEPAVRQLLHIKPTKPLSEQLLVSKIPLTHNVFLTAGGVVFVYEPYEIASYAQGEVRVFLPLSAVRPLLREGLPLGQPAL